MKSTIYHKGRVISDPAVSEELFRNEMGIFETMRLYSGIIFCEDEHLERLAESAKSIQYPYSLKLAEIKKELNKAIRLIGKKDGILRLTLIGRNLFIALGERHYPKAIYENGVWLQTSPVKRSLSNSAMPEAKTSAYQNAILATLEPREETVYEWVMLERNGYVSEVRSGNIFMLKKGVLFTPPLAGILNGVTRRFVLECASQIGLKIQEIFLTRHDFFNANEAFLTNTSWEILPVRGLDGRQIGKDIPGPQTLKLQQAFKRGVKKACQKM